MSDAPARTDSGLASIHVAGLAEANGWQPRPFGASVDGIPLVAWWPSTATPSRVVWAAIHGEEVVTLQLARHLLRVVHADDACAVVVPVLNPDGVLNGTRQNARGVDLNRNFPGAGWRAEPQPTFFSTAVRRTTEERNQLSSTGASPGSEPEVAALMALVAEVAPREVIDLHTPLECAFAFSDAAVPLAEHLAEPSGVPVLREVGSVTTGDSASWCEAQGIVSVTYEFELAPLPALWARHAESLVRCIVERR